MRKQLNGLLSQLRTEQLELLTTLVKERLATSNDCYLPKTKVFTSAELWNIQRHRKIAAPRRILF